MQAFCLGFYVLTVCTISCHDRVVAVGGWRHVFNCFYVAISWLVLFFISISMYMYNETDMYKNTYKCMYLCNKTTWTAIRNSSTFYHRNALDFDNDCQGNNKYGIDFDEFCVCEGGFYQQKQRSLIAK